MYTNIPTLTSFDNVLFITSLHFTWCEIFAISAKMLNIYIYIRLKCNSIVGENVCQNRYRSFTITTCQNVHETHSRIAKENATNCGLICLLVLLFLMCLLSTIHVFMNETKSDIFQCTHTHTTNLRLLCCSMIRRRSTDIVVVILE